MNMQVDDLLAGILKQIRLHKDLSQKGGKHGAKAEVPPIEKLPSKSPLSIFGKFLKRHLSGDDNNSCDNLMVL